MAFVSKNFVKFHGYASDADAQPNLFKYNALSDTEATVETVGYLNSVADQLQVNDLLYMVMEDGASIGLYYVSDITAGVVTILGFATIGAGGVGTAQLAAGAVTDAKVNAAAAIQFSKMEDLTSAEIIVGSAANVPTAVAMTGDVAISNAGATTIQAAAIDLAMLSAGITPSHVVKFAGQPTTVGGAAAEAFAVAGVLATDLAFVQMIDQGTNVVTALIAVCTVDTLTVTFSGNPGADAIFNYQILRAAA